MLWVTVYNSRQHEQVAVYESIVLLGRSSTGTAAISPIMIRDAEVDRCQIELQQQEDLQLRVANIGQGAVTVNDVPLAESEDTIQPLPVRLCFGQTTVWIMPAPEPRNTETARPNALFLSSPEADSPERTPVGDWPAYQRLPRPRVGMQLPDHPQEQWPAPAAATLARWFAALAGVQREAAGARKFYETVVQAIVNPGGLDAGMFLEPCHHGWRIVTSHVPDPSRGIAFDPRLADLAASTRETTWRSCVLEFVPEGARVEAAIAAPVFDTQDRVVGLLYGSRLEGERNRRREVRLSEARWLQVLAESVTSGIARATQESNLARQRVLLEQSFPPSIVQQLLRNPDGLLRSERREVTILFVDVVASSGLHDQLDPAECHQLFGDILDRLTRVVQQHEGVVVDYYGDGLVAMWNAPLDQSDHASRASRSALEMLHEQTALNSQWQRSLPQPLRLGIGIHTDEAFVGNSGSRFRVKYGPRGTAVSIASRVEKATRCLHDPVLLTEATRRHLPAGSLVRRLGRFRLEGIGQPTMLYALHGLPESSRLSDQQRTLRSRLDGYEWTLRLIEAGRLDEATASLASLANDLSGPAIPTEFLEHQLAAASAPSCWSGDLAPRELVYELSELTV